MCRALDGDVVAVELLPESQWRGASANLPQADAESATGGDDPEDDPEGGHIAQVCMTDQSSLALSGSVDQVHIVRLLEPELGDTQH